MHPRWLSVSTSLQTAWQAPMQAVERSPWLLQHCLQSGAELWPRFVSFYHHLRALPRRTRWGLGKHWATSSASLAFLLAASFVAHQVVRVFVRSASFLFRLMSGQSLAAAHEGSFR